MPLPSNSGCFSISTVTRLVLHRGSDVSTVGTGRATQPQATDSLIPSKTLEPENLTLHVTVSLLSERGLDLSCVCVHESMYERKNKVLKVGKPTLKIRAIIIMEPRSKFNSKYRNHKLHVHV